MTEKNIDDTQIKIDEGETAIVQAKDYRRLTRKKQFILAGIVLVVIIVVVIIVVSKIK